MQLVTGADASTDAVTLQSESSVHQKLMTRVFYLFQKWRRNIEHPPSPKNRGWPSLYGSGGEETYFSRVRHMRQIIKRSQVVEMLQLFLKTSCKIVKAEITKYNEGQDWNQVNHWGWKDKNICTLQCWLRRFVTLAGRWFTSVFFSCLYC